MMVSTHRTLSILIVEDDHALAELLRCVVNDVPGWGAIVVHDAAAALGVLRHVRVGLLLLDVNLPSMSGPELLFRLHRDPRLATVPAVLMSANAKPPEVERMLERGEVATFVHKPFDVDELADALDAAAATTSSDSQQVGTAARRAA
ncbi:MAG: response regulator [Chloroflexota bacterium]